MISFSKKFRVSCSLLIRKAHSNIQFLVFENFDLTKNIQILVKVLLSIFYIISFLRCLRSAVELVSSSEKWYDYNSRE